MQLSNIRTNPVIKFFIYIGFSLIIISFVSFYGWNTSSRHKEQVTTSYGRLDSPSKASFLPGRGEKLLQAKDVKIARNEAIMRKRQMLPPQLIQMLQQQGQGLTGLVTDREAVRRAADHQLLLGEANRLGLIVTDEEIDAFVKQNFTSMDTLTQFLNQEGIDYAQLRERLRGQQEAARAERLIADRANVSLYELWQEYRLNNEKLKLEIVPFSADNFTKDVTVGDDEMQKFLADHEDEFRVPAKRRYAYVQLSRQEIRDGLNPADDELKLFWEQNQTLFNRPSALPAEDIFAPVTSDQPTTSAMRLVTMLGERATTASQWADLALEIEKENPGARIYYRDLGMIDDNEKNQADFGNDYLTRLKNMAPNEVSTPVVSPRGVHIIHRLGAGTARTFEQAREEVVGQYKEKKSLEILRDRAAKLREAVERAPSIRELAQAEGLKDNLTTLTLASATFVPEIGNLQEHATYLRGLKLNQVSKLIPMPSADPAAHAALQIVEERPAYLPQLAEVREEIHTRLAKQKGAELAKAAAENALGMIRDGKADFAAATSGSKIDHVTTQLFTRMQRVGYPLVNFERDSLRATKDSVGVSPYGSSEKAPDGYAVWRVVEAQPPTREEFQKARRGFERDMLSIQQMSIVEEWLADQRKRANFRVTAQLGDEKSAAGETGSSGKK